MKKIKKSIIIYILAINTWSSVFSAEYPFGNLPEVSSEFKGKVSVPFFENDFRGSFSGKSEFSRGTGCFFVSTTDDMCEFTDNRQVDIEKLEHLASEGSTYAQYEIAICYYEGIGVPKNIKTAVKWLRTAAIPSECQSSSFDLLPLDEFYSSNLSENQVNTKAQYMLGIYYIEEAKKTSSNREEAKKWFELAAAGGCIHAQQALLRYYSHDSKANLLFESPEIDNVVGEYNRKKRYKPIWNISAELFNEIKRLKSTNVPKVHIARALGISVNVVTRVEKRMIEWESCDGMA